MTLARVKRLRGGELSKILRSLSEVEVGEMTVKFLRLKRSILTPKGPIYSNLYEVKAVEQS